MAIKKCIIVNNQPIQLLNKANYSATQTVNGVTFTNNGDGSYTVSGTATDNANLYISGTIACKPNTKYLLSGCPAGGSWSAFNIYVTQANDSGWLSDTADNGDGIIFTTVANASKFSSVVLRINVGQTVNITFKPQLVALTETFGAGNEPATVAVYKAKFPNDVYPYNLSNIANSYKKAVKVADVCQLLNKDDFAPTTTLNGVTFTNNGDGSYTLNGTADGAPYFNICNLWNRPLRGTVNIDWVMNGYWAKNCTYDEGNGWVYFWCVSGKSFDNEKIYPQIYDLYETFGEANAPEYWWTAKEKIPDDLYPYAPKCFVDCYDKKVKVADVCNLLDKNTFVATTTVNGITFTNNGDGSYTINGTSTASGNTWFNICNIGKNRFNGQNAYSAQINSMGIWGIDCTYSSSNGYVFYTVGAGVTISSKKIYPQLIDLWETFGKANAPTTVAAAKAKLPADSYPYAPKCFV